MSRMKDLMIDLMEGDEPGPTELDFMMMQRDAAHSELSVLSERLDYIEWRLTFFCDEVTPEGLEEIRRHVTALKKILA